MLRLFYVLFFLIFVNITQIWATTNIVDTIVPDCEKSNTSNISHDREEFLNPCLLSQIPSEIIQHIFIYLDKQSYACVTRVNRFCHLQAESSALWKEYAHQSNIPVNLFPFDTEWKKLVQHQSCINFDAIDFLVDPNDWITLKGISGDGSTVFGTIDNAEYTNNLIGPKSFFIWRKEYKKIIPNQSKKFINHISTNGTIVSGSLAKEDSFEPFQWIWQSSAHEQPFEAIDGLEQCLLYNISGNQKSYIGFNKNRKLFVWCQTQGYQELSGLSPEYFSRLSALCTNYDGSLITVNSTSFNGSVQGYYSYTSNNNTKFVPLKNSSFNHLSIQALSMNHNVIVGQASLKTETNGKLKAYICHIDQHTDSPNIVLLHTPEELSSTALCLNHDGSVIGGYITLNDDDSDSDIDIDNQDPVEAVLWIKDHMFYIKDLFKQHFKDIDVNAWHFQYVDFISYDGCTFAGTGTYQDVSTGWRITIPRKYLM